MSGDSEQGKPKSSEPQSNMSDRQVCGQDGKSSVWARVRIWISGVGGQVQACLQCSSGEDQGRELQHEGSSQGKDRGPLLSLVVCFFSTALISELGMNAVSQTPRTEGACSGP